MIKRAPSPAIRHCRCCGCTEHDCRQCIELTGKPCHWVGPDLCSACFDIKANAHKTKPERRQRA